MSPFRMVVRLCLAPRNVTQSRGTARWVALSVTCCAALHPLSPGYCRTRSQIAVALRIVSGLSVRGAKSRWVAEAEDVVNVLDQPASCGDFLAGQAFTADDVYVGSHLRFDLSN